MDVTSNPERHPRLELVDPEAGGDGTANRLDLVDQQQRSVLQLLIGSQGNRGTDSTSGFGEETAFLIAEQLMRLQKPADAENLCSG